MSGTSPQKDQLVHNNLTHKLLFHCRGMVTLDHFGDIVHPVVELNGKANPILVRVEPEGFSVTKAGASFVLANIAREFLSHREVKIMKDMTKPPMTLRAALPAAVPAAMVPVDPNMAAASIF